VPARVPPPLLTRAQYFAAWSRLHGGYDPAAGSRWVRGWLAAAYAGARPLAARGVAPDTVTLLGLVVGAGVPAAFAAGARWPLLGAVLAVLTGAVDGLDGAVAVVSCRTSRWGWLLDSVVDRLTDIALLLALGLLGAPWPLAVAAVLLAFLQEYARARAAAAGRGEVGVVTVAERPTRISVAAVAGVLAAVLPGRAEQIATLVAVAAVVLGAVGCVQLARALRRSLREEAS